MIYDMDFSYYILYLAILSFRGLIPKYLLFPRNCRLSLKAALQYVEERSRLRSTQS